jgi:hypothetical protein
VELVDVPRVLWIGDAVVRADRLHLGASGRRRGGSGAPEEILRLGVGVLAGEGLQHDHRDQEHHGHQDGDAADQPGALA